MANTIHQHLTIVSIPLPLAKQKTQSTVKKTHLFIVNELKDPILDKIADKIDNATFATKRGQQGLVPWPFHEEMQDNHWKPCAMKLKVFDKELDCRVWLTAHHDTTGEHTLFVAEGLKNEVT